jgi:glycosyltransferase involved in cell wall biosynthesis
MDLCADELLVHLAAVPGVEAQEIAPPFRRRLSRLPGRATFNADRLLNRHLDLPRFARCAARRFDFVHVVDHSYAHVVLHLPPSRAGVYCHDLDAFRCLLDASRDPRPWWFRRIAHRILTGLRRAAVVFHSTAAVHDELLCHGLVEPDRLVCAPYGVAADFTPHTIPVEQAVNTIGPFLLHVGVNVPRKRLDVLLDVFAAVRSRVPGLRLVQVGGPWPAPLAERIARLGIGPSIVQVHGLTRPQLADLYRRAVAVLVTSEAEGFGLPVVEALACGTAVIASDLPTLREAGGEAATYCPVGDVPAWVDAVTRRLHSPSGTVESRVRHAARFSWREHARIIGETYLRLANDR